MCAVFILLLQLFILMDNSVLASLLVGGRPTTPVVEKVSPTTEIVPFKIPTGIIDLVMANHYAGDRHSGVHLLYLSELCALFKLAGVSSDVVMRKLFSLSLKDKAWEWYRLLDDSHLLNWKELVSGCARKHMPPMKRIVMGARETARDQSPRAMTPRFTQVREARWRNTLLLLVWLYGFGGLQCATLSREEYLELYARDESSEDLAP